MELDDLIRQTHKDMILRPVEEYGGYDVVDEPDPLMFWVIMGFTFWFTLMFMIANFQPY